MTLTIKRALLSVSDKSGLLELAQGLHAQGVELISTGGTAALLRAAGLPVRDVSTVTGFPEILGGRVKTLHPMIHGGLLAVRQDPDHQRQVETYGLPLIDLVVVNLYPFAQTVARNEVTLTEALEEIDIGGPTLIRAAAKNFHDVAVLVDPADYAPFLEELHAQGSVSLATRLRLAQKAFAHVAEYDAAIADFFANRLSAGEDGVRIEPETETPLRLAVTLYRQQGLRYGENPHQKAALYRLPEDEPGVATARQLQGKDLSFNNYLDLDAAWALVTEFSEPACAIIKHTNPCGVATGETPAAAYRKALATDPVSAFGGIVGFNRPVTVEAAQALVELFLEAVIAPGYEPEALAILAQKKNLRVMLMELPLHGASPERRWSPYDLKRISGGLLLQTRDRLSWDPSTLRVVTRREPTTEEMEALRFAWIVCKHVKSNAIVLARPDQLIGVGAGQMSRVDSVKLAAMKAILPTEGSVLASDAFFPFRDGIDEAARHGVRAIIQPGGSIRDSEVIRAADEHGLAMVFTGIRHFKH
ncbi:MAG: bifunctional phosphoribosylaminoimidazolecarboxamide formyltransferase/IMP cyclohydrolase [Blastocatellia bacterium]|nr:bifunctional phosphoribosylaminoimidazolecarboxamide formyltransferase/IMP cyclohydrolase [Blastocatellia bacterium]MCS7157162.1 bifunctional phosphoribosylaminoimidazolecarboxamide formyltransferase/IMP cyclohydrolase [Blastocatellia bacterium]MCX7752375.1 bifunctional phosphoribosylaminoimidazolecarboxamide formyltransferase/IMP cyclohydrolase [Blastocatellia bacterium]MDW8167256.1 bifunctional phosphoribosylaminoimidazolecarboxamide formyltransferase/IMP cyclohydrolase [Acidobacteriota bac